MDYYPIDDFKGTLIKLGSDFPTGKIYNVFLKQIQKQKDSDKILKVYRDFVNSKKFRMYGNNLNKKSELIGFY